MFTRSFCSSPNRLQRQGGPPAGASLLIAPIASDGMPRSTGDSYTYPERALSARRVLVVDDNVDVVDALGTLIELAGHEARVAHSGAEALTAMASFHPQIVLLDLSMPEMDGYETCRRLRAGTCGEDVTIVALTGLSQPADRTRSQEAGFDAHWVKPINLSALTALLGGTLVEE